MEVRELCQTVVATIDLEESVQEATWRMREEHVGDLVVVSEKDGGRIPEGMLTDRDIVIDLLAEGARDLEAERVGEVMSEELYTVGHDASVEDALALMQTHGVRRLPVVDAGGELFGIVSLDDMLSYLTNQMAALASVVGAEIRHEVERDR